VVSTYKDHLVSSIFANKTTSSKSSGACNQKYKIKTWNQLPISNMNEYYKMRKNKRYFWIKKL